MYAIGIQDKNDRPDLPVIKKRFTTNMVIHNHRAERAGEHKDLRIDIPGMGLFSWAGKEIPGPGKSTYFIEQPIHDQSYIDFKGEIPNGYGKGHVDIHTLDKIEILNSRPGHISFVQHLSTGPRDYTLHEVGDGIWKLYNRTINREKVNIPSDKVKYKEIHPDQAHLGEDYVMQAKIDDAFNIIYLGDKGDPIRVFSHRQAKRGDTGLIEHTYKVKSLEDERVKPETRNTVIRGGLYGLGKNGRPLDPNTIAGMLNTNTWKSREKQDQLGDLKIVIYDIDKYKGRDMKEQPYKNKLEILHKLVQEHPSFSLPEMAFTQESKTQLLNRIKNKIHEHTDEGVVLHNLYNYERPIKAKFNQDHNVYIREFFPGSGKYTNKAIGGFKFSHTADGPIVGEVGTGLSDRERIMMYKHPEKFIGTNVVVRANGIYPSGALKQPSFITYHLENNETEKLEEITKLLE